MIYFIQKLAWVVTKSLAIIFLGFKVEGQHNFKRIKQNQFIIVANHFGYIDAFLASDAVPLFKFLRTDFRYMTTPKWIDVYPFIKLCGSYPIYRGQKSLEETLESTEEFLKDGKSLLIFPEGGFAINGEKKPVRRGIAYLAQKYNLPIIPVAISGSDQLNGVNKFDMKKMFSNKYSVKAKVGKPFYYSDIAKSGESYQEVAQKMMKRVYIML